MQFGAGNVVAKFDAKAGDPLYRWANRRAEYLAMANIASANMVRQNNTGYSFMNGGGWFYNPFFGMYTFLPAGNGMYRSPFGYMYYSPQRVNRYYQSFQQPVAPSINAGMGGGQGNRTWNSDNGYYTTSSRSAGAVSMPANSGGAPAASAPAAPAGRGADVGTGRGGGAGSSGK